MYTNSSFKLLNMCMFTYAAPTFITEALRLVSHVQLLLITYSKLMPYTMLANSYLASFNDTY